VTCNFVPYSFNGIYRLNPERQSHPVYPVEYFLSLKDAAVCLKELYAAYPKRQMVRGRAEIDGVDLSSLVKGEIDRSFNSGQVLMNKALYCGIRNAVRRLKPDSVLSTFENRSWEKMIISASRDANPRVKVTGYFHTSLTPQHLHMLFEDGEKESMPFPDRIIVAGGTVQTILEDVCRFPKGIISVGCALRQEKLYAPSGDPGPVPEDILVVLASSTDEYVRMLQFLDRAVIGDKYRIRIRPHPAISFTKALRIYTPGRLTYTLDSHKRSIDSVRDARCVLYASSTVSIEAIAMGTPVVYIDFGNFIDTDPLFTARSLKWTCREPNELQSVIEKISSIDAVVMGDGRQEARTFARGYFREVTVDTVRPFILAA
jgi:surface carbohydrate biosynthesis protein (TIGR04326 family)